MTNWDFTIEYLAVGMGNPTHHNLPALVDATVQIGPMRLRAHLDMAGKLTIDPALCDLGLRVAIAAAMREAALLQLASKFARQDASDRSHALACAEALAASPPTKRKAAA
jgi:hypothetical protein